MLGQLRYVGSRRCKYFDVSVEISYWSKRESKSFRIQNTLRAAIKFQFNSTFSCKYWEWQKCEFRTWGQAAWNWGWVERQRVYEFQLPHSIYSEFFLCIWNELGFLFKFVDYMSFVILDKIRASLELGKQVNRSEIDWTNVHKSNE